MTKGQPPSIKPGGYLDHGQPVWKEAWRLSRTLHVQNWLILKLWITKSVADFVLVSCLYYCSCTLLAGKAKHLKIKINKPTRAAADATLKGGSVSAKMTITMHGNNRVEFNGVAHSTSWRWSSSLIYILAWQQSASQSPIRMLVAVVVRRLPSGVFDRLHSLGVLKPGGGPGGLDAGSVFEPVAVGRQVGVALLMLLADGREKTKRRK